MNTIHNNGDNDQSLSEGLDKLEQAYSQLPQDKPPEILNQAILNSAHRAVEKKPHWMKFGWLHGLTTAAVFVLAFSIIINQHEPVSETETGMGNKDPVQLKRENAAKKQATGIRSDAPVMELKSGDEKPRGFILTAPVSASLESVEQEADAENAASPMILEAQRSIETGDVPQIRERQFDKYEVKTDILKEELASDESDLMLDSRQSDTTQKLASPAAMTEPVTSDELRAKKVSEAQQKLLEIIKLKRSGDHTWKTELEYFRNKYPDYPLPDELRQ